MEKLQDAGVPQFLPCPPAWWSPHGLPPGVHDHRRPQLLWVRTSGLLGSCDGGSRNISRERAAHRCGPFVHGRTTCCLFEEEEGFLLGGFLRCLFRVRLGHSFLVWGDCPASCALFHCRALCCCRTWTRNGTRCVRRQPALQPDLQHKTFLRNPPGTPSACSPPDALVFSHISQAL